MSEEAKQQKPEEEKPKEEKPKEEKPVAEAQPAEKKEAGAEKKKQKINRLGLKEVEKKIEEVQAKMGSLTSSYAQQLLKRKQQLTGGNNAADA